MSDLPTVNKSADKQENAAVGTEQTSLQIRADLLHNDCNADQRKAIRNAWQNDQATNRGLPNVSIGNDGSISFNAASEAPNAAAKQEGTKQDNGVEDAHNVLDDIKKYGVELGPVGTGMKVLNTAYKMEQAAEGLGKVSLLETPAQKLVDLGAKLHDSKVGTAAEGIYNSDALKPIRNFQDAKELSHREMQNALRGKLGLSPIKEPKHSSGETKDESGNGRHRKPDEASKPGEAHKSGEATKSGETPKPGEASKPGEAPKSGEAPKPGDALKPGAKAAEKTAEEASKAAKAAEFAGKMAGRMAGPLALGLGVVDVTQGVEALRHGNKVEGGVMIAAGAMETAGGALDTTGILAPVGEVLQGVGALTELGITAFDNRKAIGDAAKKAGRAVEETGKKAEHAVEQTVQKAGHTVEETGKKAEHAVEQTAKKVANLFGF